MAVRKTSKNNRAFKGVWIPAKYWLDPDLTINEVAAMAEIDSLDNADGCIASNKHFADFLGVSAGRASQIINGLKDKGYIIISYDRNGKQIVKRKIRVFNKLNTPLVNKLNRGIKNTKEGYLENCEDSNTSNSNTYSNTDDDDTSSLSSIDESPFALANSMNINVNSGTHITVFIDYIHRLGNQLVCWALHQTDDNAQYPNWSYLLSVLKSLEDNSIKTVEQAEKHQQLRKKQRQRSGGYIPAKQTKRIYD